MLALLALAVGACASAKVKPGSRVDLGAAQQAVEAARKAGAPAKAPDMFKQAERHLREAESVAGAKDLTPEKSARAQGLGEVGLSGVGRMTGWIRTLDPCGRRPRPAPVYVSV